MEIKGKYGVAKVYASLIDGNTKVQIKELMDQKFIKDLDVRIMADCHAGKGCVIGTTMKVKDKIVPNLVGVDIGCGMLTVKLGKMDINLVKLSFSFCNSFLYLFVSMFISPLFISIIFNYI